MSSESDKPRRWFKLTDARRVTGHTSNEALSDWCRTWNEAHPMQRIERRRGFVECESLFTAAQLDAKNTTQRERAKTAMAQLRRWEEYVQHGEISIMDILRIRRKNYLERRRRNSKR